MGATEVNRFTLIFATLQACGFALVAARLFQLRLHKTFRFFTAFCLLEPVRIGVSLLFPRDTDAYTRFYMATEPVLWLLFILITFEIFRYAFERHPGILTAGRKAMSWCLGAAVVVAAATAGIDLSAGGAEYPTLEAFFLIQRTVTVSLLLFIVLLMALLSWFPVPLNRNILLHCVVFAFFFAARIALLFSRNLFGADFTRTANTGALAVSIVCLALWSLFLVRSQDARMVRSGIPRSREAEERLMAQLEAINDTLSGTMRK